MANKNYFKQFGKGEGVQFMDGRDGASLKDLRDKSVQIDEFAFIKTENGKCAVFTVRGENEKFYFANQALNDMLESVLKDNMVDDLREMCIHFYTKISKNRREYTTFEFVDLQTGESL